jgi:hypothetical protein
VWCVVDTDDHATLQEAIRLAEGEGVQVCVSNPCFELWPILHFQDHTSYTTPSGLSTVMAGIFPGYDKSFPCERLAGNFMSAKARALRLEAMHTSAGDAAASNPSTDIWRIVDALCASARSNGSPVDLDSL